MFVTDVKYLNPAQQGSCPVAHVKEDGINLSGVKGQVSFYLSLSSKPFSLKRDRQIFETRGS